MITHPQVLDSTLHEGNNSLLVNCSNALAERLALWIPDREVRISKPQKRNFILILPALYNFTLLILDPTLGILQA